MAAWIWPAVKNVPWRWHDSVCLLSTCFPHGGGWGGGGKFRGFQMSKYDVMFVVWKCFIISHLVVSCRIQGRYDVV